MARWPVVSANELIKALEHQGFRTLRQKGSHIVVQKRTSTGTVTTVVPNHKELAPGTLRSILTRNPHLGWMKRVSPLNVKSLFVVQPVDNIVQSL